MTIFTRAMLAFVCMLALTGAGCTWAEWLSINQRRSLGSTDAVFTDAKQRLVVATPVEESAFYGYLKPKQIVCAEPSPDVAQAVSGSIAATLDAAVSRGGVSAQGSGSLALATAESIAQLGERLGTIQLLRDKAYRACEAYANGAISATTYTLILSRLDRTMTTLLLGEMASGAFGRRLASASTSASASVLPRVEDMKTALDKTDSEKKNLDKATADRDAKKQELDKAKKDAGDSPTDAQKKQITTLNNDVADLDQKVADSKTNLARVEGVLREKAVSVTAAGNVAADIGQIAQRSNSTDIGKIIDLQRQFLEASEAPVMLDACVTAMDRVPLPKESHDALDNIARIVGELRKGRPDQSQLELLSRSRPDLSSKLKSTAEQPAEQMKAAEDEIAKIMAETPGGALSKICLLNIASLFHALTAAERPFTKAHVETETLSLQILQTQLAGDRTKLCHAIWEEASKKGSSTETQELAKSCLAATFAGGPKP